jgi:putative AbiEi antitoxin of type IV toxin-antitoxin system
MAAKQHGVIARAQMAELGLTRAKIEWRVATNRWERLRPGVYGIAGSPPSWRRDLIAACFAAGPRAAASHRSAALLRGLAGFDLCLPELTVPRDRRRLLPGVVLHWADLSSVDVTVVDAIPVTSAARTMIDLAAVVSRDNLEEALDDALRRKIVTLSWLKWRLTRIGRRPGVAVIRDLVQERTDRSGVPESVLETKVLRVFKKGGLPRPVIQHEVPETDGSIRVDAAYPELRIAIEVDGWDPHGGRIPFDKDRARRNVLTGLGWYVVHVTWTDLKERPEEVIRTVRAVIAERVREG